MPDISKILQLSNYFQVSTDYLLREEIEMPTAVPRPDSISKTAAEETYREENCEETSHPHDSSCFDTEPASASDKRPFDRAFKISLRLTIAFLLLPFIILLLASSLPVSGMRLGTTELLLIISVVYFTIVPVTGVLTLVFWILRHFKK